MKKVLLWVILITYQIRLHEWCKGSDDQQANGAHVQTWNSAPAKAMQHFKLKIVHDFVRHMCHLYRQPHNCTFIAPVRAPSLCPTVS